MRKFYSKTIKCWLNVADLFKMQNTYLMSDALLIVSMNSKITLSHVK